MLENNFRNGLLCWQRDTGAQMLCPFLLRSAGPGPGLLSPYLVHFHWLYLCQTDTLFWTTSGSVQRVSKWSYTPTYEPIGLVNFLCRCSVVYVPLCIWCPRIVTKRPLINSRVLWHVTIYPTRGIRYHRLFPPLCYAEPKSAFLRGKQKPAKLCCGRLSCTSQAKQTVVEDGL